MKPSKEIEKVYQPDQVERRTYAFWLDKKLFRADPKSGREPFTIVIPPPNVTARLHMGHAYNNMVQDLIIRFRKMQGYETLWMPGTDHAGIATQTVVERDLKKDGKSRHDLGREAFVERVWKWKEEHGEIIIDQLRQLGCACDWDRERFTMDEGLSDAVKLVFIRLHERGLIYKGQRIVNWDPASGTALSDDEVDHEELQGKLYHIRYHFKDSKDTLVVATTRPETLLGDTAVAIAPDDDEKKQMLGRQVIIPFVNRSVEIISDSHVDKSFGSGFVKVTPAHDPNDFEIGQRHQLDQVIMMDTDGKVLPVCRKVRGSDNSDELAIPEFLAGKDRFVARKLIVDALKESGDLVEIEEHTHTVGHSYRTGVPIEPYLSEQWFVRMQPLAEKALQAVRDGRVKLHPEGRYDKTYEHWMLNIRDWCISRQLWWGHRIPAWYNDKGEIKVSAEDPSTETEAWRQDPDVLDTWFSSQLWPFSTMGWPEQTPELAKFYPTQALVTGPDIIFFWVARMIMAGLEFMEEIPFENVYFNGIVRDKQNRKMSKSLGNGIDPLEMVEKYSADAVRYTLLSLSSEGNDIQLDKNDFEIGRNFTNKLWNAFRFLGMQLNENITSRATEEMIAGLQDQGKLDISDQWMLSRLHRTIADVTAALENYKFHEAHNALHSLFWRGYCDWYLELIKPRMYGEDAEAKDTALLTATYVLRSIVRMLHPVVPFITEEIWQHVGLSVSESVMSAPWPVSQQRYVDQDAETRLELLQQLVNAVRNIRGEMNIPPKKEAELLVSGTDSNVDSLLQNNMDFFSQLARVSSIRSGAELERPALAASAVVRQLELYLPLAGLIDIDVERQRLQKEMLRLEKQLDGLSRKLQNRDFLDRAPAAVVEREEQKMQDWKATYNKLVDNLEQLKN